MGRAKGLDILFIRKKLQETGAEAEKAFLDQLTPEEEKMYRTAVAVSWFPIEVNAKMQGLAAPILFPNQLKAVQEIGRMQAKEDLGGIYKILLKIVTVPALLKQISNLWKNYNDTGQMTAIRRGDEKSAVLMIENYPDYPKVGLDDIEGYILGCLEMTGAKGISILPNYHDPFAWKYYITWK